MALPPVSPVGWQWLAVLGTMVVMSVGVLVLASLLVEADLWHGTAVQVAPTPTPLPLLQQPPPPPPVVQGRAARQVAVAPPATSLLPPHRAWVE